MPIKKEPLDLPYFNSTNYPLAVKGQLSQAHFDELEAKLLRYHQFIVKEFFTRNPNQRGLLICHGMGQGKTRLAVSIADYMRTFDSHRRIIVLSAKSLEANFRKELTAYTGKEDGYIDKNYKFISLNSSNMFRKVNSVDRTAEANELENRLGDFMDDVIRDSSLEGSLLIIDEAHNLFNSITNGAKNALALYDLIMSTKNIKLLFMSGTPIINDPFELVPCFNMIRGPMKVDILGGLDDDSLKDVDDSPKDHNDTNQDLTDSNIKDIDDSPNVDDSTSVNKKDPDSNQDQIDTTSNKKDKDTRHKNKHNKFARPKKSSSFTNLFSEDIDEFEDYFVDKQNKRIKNKDKFTNRIYGLCSYYGDLYFKTNEAKEGFPKELETIIEKVPMSHVQFARYISARILEQDETKKGYRMKDSRFSSASGGSSTYRVKSRQISNYCIPEYALGPARGAKSREKFINKITLDDLQNVSEYSPKMAKIIENIESHNKQKGIVYSQFVSGEGIAIFAKVLEALGYTRYGSTPNGASETDVDVKEKEKKVFATLTGDVPPELRSEIISNFNQPNSTIKLLLLSSAVAEGIDLKRVRHVHIMEPFWNYARINQVKTRAIRFLSHDDMPESERNVQVYIYLSEYPTDTPKNKRTELTTDIDLYTKSIDNMYIINSFIEALAESSIDCAMHYDKLDDEIKTKIKCKLCSPDGAFLFHPLITKDMNLPNTCKPHSDHKVTVSPIEIPGIAEKFYYSKLPDGNFKIYHFNKKLNGYAPLLRSHPLYADIMAAVVLIA